MVTALVLLFRLRAAEADHRVRADLLADLLRSNAPDRALVERGRLLGLRLREPHVVVVCRGERPRGLLLAASQAGGGAGLSGEHADAVVALVPGRDPSAVATALAGKFAVTVGTAGPIVPADGVARALAEARTAADTLVALGRAGHGAALADLGFVGLVAADRVDVDAYLARVLGPLLDYDAAARHRARGHPRRRTSRAARARGGPRCSCTCTPTRWRSGSTGSACCWAPTGRRRSARWSCSSPCGCSSCAASAPTSSSSSSKASSPIQIRRPSPSSVM